MAGERKRWISLYVENDVGVLAKIAGLFSGKSYNLLLPDPVTANIAINLLV